MRIKRFIEDEPFNKRESMPEIPKEVTEKNSQELRRTSSSLEKEGRETYRASPCKRPTHTVHWPVKPLEDLKPL